MTTIEIEDLLGAAVRNGIANADVALVDELAMRLWSSGEVPHLSRLPPDLWPDAGYLIETLIRQRAFSTAHRMNVLTMLQIYKRKLAIPPVTKDYLAAEWGATSSLLPLLDKVQRCNDH